MDSDFSSAEESKYWFNPVWMPLDIMILVSLIGLYAFVFIKLRFKIDFSGIVTLLLHLFVALQRVVNHFIDLKDWGKVYYDLAQILGECFIWISLYYFTFELFLIKSTVEAESLHEL